MRQSLYMVPQFSCLIDYFFRSYGNLLKIPTDFFYMKGILIALLLQSTTSEAARTLLLSAVPSMWFASQ